MSACGHCPVLTIIWVLILDRKSKRCESPMSRSEKIAQLSKTDRRPNSSGSLHIRDPSLLRPGLAHVDI